MRKHGRLTAGVLDSPLATSEDIARECLIRALVDECGSALQPFFDRRQGESLLQQKDFLEWCRTLGWSESWLVHGVAARYELSKNMPNATIGWLTPVIDRPERPDRDKPLAPVSADPFVESQAEFLQRARVHWQAVVASLTQKGMKPSRQKRQDAHFRWLAKELLGHTGRCQ